MTPFPLEGGRAGDGGDRPAVSAEDVDGATHPTPRLSDLGQPAPGGVSRARRLRREQTVAERALWQALRRLDQDWRRQAPIGPYVADFVRHADRTVVEVDGYYHTLAERRVRDAERTAYLNKAGYRVLRFADADVIEKLEQVVAGLAKTPAEPLRVQPEAAGRSPPTPALPPSRGKGE